MYDEHIQFVINFSSLSGINPRPVKNRILKPLMYLFPLIFNSSTFFFFDGINSSTYFFPF